MKNDILVTCQLSHQPEEVWKAYCERHHEWWTSDFFTSERTKRFVFDFKLGGHLFEDFGDREGLIWGTIIGIDSPKEFLVQGTLDRPFGGPCITLEKTRFEAHEGGTLLSYTLDFIGQANDKTKKSLREGWQSILRDHFKPYCDKTISG